MIEFYLYCFMFTAESIPNVIDMKKNSIAQIFDPGNVATASGYT